MHSGRGMGEIIIESRGSEVTTNKTKMPGH